MPSTCEALVLFNRLHRLLKRWSDKNRLTAYDQKVLRAAILKWQDIECPENGKSCVPSSCLFAYPFEWVTWRGDADLADLIYRLDSENLSGPFPEPSKRDIHDVKGARRHGHYNP